ncbi:hypothetical protein MUU74_15830 [Chryseobacterium daecheongense]|uniref:hypothetical protein n=1 Tax=Chryseobacterium daecheongense TaxID=192389 RepID=UPI001FD66468|nr:hypothetical protein [Chryseobacterium daecheongense]UOU97951.1 hypothetical protein MUU74_15830 [Chryseobacterium daecheongense]
MKFKVILFIFIAFSAHYNAQTKEFKKATLDTLRYLKTFETNKAEYIGKPFSYLLSKMTKIQPKTVWIVPNSNDSTVLQKSLFRFYDMNYPIMNETKMLITWKIGLPYKTVNFNTRRNKFYFSDSERKFYENKIIEDILIYR